MAPQKWPNYFIKSQTLSHSVDTFSPRSTPISDAVVRRHLVLSSFDYYITVHDMQLTSIRELAAVIKDRRRIKGWSQAALAERVGVSRDWIINLEKAKPTIELGLVFRALKALDLSLALAPAPAPPEGSIDLGKILGSSPPQP